MNTNKTYNLSQAIENKKIIEKSNESIKLYNATNKIKPADTDLIAAIQEIILDSFNKNDVFVKFSDGPMVILDEDKKILELQTKIICENFDVNPKSTENIENIENAISDFIKTDLKRFDNPIAYIQHILVLNKNSVDYTTGQILENDKPSIQVTIKMTYDQTPKDI